MKKGYFALLWESLLVCVQRLEVPFELTVQSLTYFLFREGGFELLL